jgi:lipoprotein-releasing system permease protein
LNPNHIYQIEFRILYCQRLINAKDYKSSISAPIIKIAISAIAIGMIMMIVSVATGIGLQQKNQRKISAFNGHIIISNYDNNQSEVALVPISKNRTFILSLM